MSNPLPAVAIEGLSKRYRDGRQALHGLDLRIPAGAFFGLLGPNGAGKTTLIGLMTSLLRLDAGTLRIFGHDLRREAVAAKRLIGLVPQEVNFNSFDPVGEIVVNQGRYYGMRPAAARRRALETLRLVGLEDRAGKSAWGLSGGMKRRLMLARALVHAPRLLILDEPTAGIDIEARQQSWAMLRRFNAEGTTILLTTHNLEEAETLCDELAVIDSGRLIARDRPRNLLDGLQSQHLILELEATPTAAPELPDGRVRALGERSLEVDWPRGRGFDRLLSALAAQGLTVVGMRNGSNRLESRLLELLAANAREATA